MGYQSSRERLKKLIEDHFVEAVKQQDLDYEKVKSWLVSESGCSPNIVDDAIQTAVKNNLFSEVHLLTIPEEKIDDWLQDIKKGKEAKAEADDFVECLERGFTNGGNKK